MIHPELLELSFFQLNVLFTTAKYESASKAAEDLNMTQSAITKIIQRAETSLHVQIFDRSNKGLFITDDGRELLQKLEYSFSEMNSTLSMFYNRHQQGPDKLSIALASTINSSVWFWPQVDEFQLLHPDIRLDIEGDLIWDMREKILSNTYDIIFVPEYEKYIYKDFHDLNWGYAQKYPLSVYFHKNHAFAHGFPQKLYDLRDETFLVYTNELLGGYSVFFDHACCQQEFYPNRILPQRSPYMVESVLRKDDGILLDGSHFNLLNETDTIKKVDFPENTLGIIAVWNTSNRNPAIKKFLDLMNIKTDHSRRFRNNS